LYNIINNMSGKLKLPAAKSGFKFSIEKILFLIFVAAFIGLIIWYFVGRDNIPVDPKCPTGQVYINNDYGTGCRPQSCAPGQINRGPRNAIFAICEPVPTVSIGTFGPTPTPAITTAPLITTAPPITTTPPITTSPAPVIISTMTPGITITPMVPTLTSDVTVAPVNTMTSVNPFSVVLPSQNLTSATNVTVAPVLFTIPPTATIAPTTTMPVATIPPTTTQPAPLHPMYGFQNRYYGYDVGGDDVRFNSQDSLPYANINTCKYVCDHKPECTGIVATNAGQCWPKNFANGSALSGTGTSRTDRTVYTDFTLALPPSTQT
jgi:hypothetical protein